MWRLAISSSFQSAPLLLGLNKQQLLSQCIWLAGLLGTTLEAVSGGSSELGWMVVVGTGRPIFNIQQ
jgi:hypothetical protein